MQFWPLTLIITYNWTCNSYSYLVTVNNIKPIVICPNEHHNRAMACDFFRGEITGPGVEKLPSISHRPTWKWTQVAMATADVGRFH